MTDEIMKALDLLDEPETVSEYDKRQQERRRLFFKAMGIADDGRLNPQMTRDEFLAFDKLRKDENKNWQYLKDKTLVEIFFEFASYYDISYSYCFEDDVVYESRFYVGD